MQKILLTIDNQQNVKVLLNLIKDLEFIRSVELTTPVAVPFIKTNKQNEQTTDCKFSSWEEFEEGLGIWEDRDITKESLRNKAWRTV